MIRWMWLVGSSLYRSLFGYESFIMYKGSVCKIPDNSHSSGDDGVVQCTHSTSNEVSAKFFAFFMIFCVCVVFKWDYVSDVLLILYYIFFVNIYVIYNIMYESFDKSASQEKLLLQLMSLKGIFLKRFLQWW